MASFFRYSLDGKGRLICYRGEEEIRKEAFFNGLFIIKTNSQDLSQGALALGCKTLWEVKNAFREVICIPSVAKKTLSE